MTSTSKNIICIRCGKIKSSFDFYIDMDTKYVILKTPIYCPRCKIETEQIATGKIDSLRKQLETNPNAPLDSYVLKLVKR